MSDNGTSSFEWAERANFNYRLERMSLDEIVDEITKHGRLIGMNMGNETHAIYHSWYIARCREELARRQIPNQG
jgi:hypothetical protein